MQDEWSRLRHDFRSGFNNVRLCVAAFETETDPAEQLQWLAYVEKAADKCLGILDQIDQLADQTAQSNASADAPRPPR
jgi:hypothetical protein